MDKETIPVAVTSEKQYQFPTMQGVYWTVASEATATRSEGEESWVGVASADGRYAEIARYAVAWKICMVLKLVGWILWCVVKYRRIVKLYTFRFPDGQSDTLSGLEEVSLV